MSKKARTAWVAVPTNNPDDLAAYPWLFKTRRECEAFASRVVGMGHFRSVRVTITPAKGKKGKSK